MDEVRIPGDAIDPDLKDVSAPITGALTRLYLLPNEEDLNKAGGPAAVVGGPPQSVALIEAGATALTKWWAGGAGVTIAGIWAAVRRYYDSEGESTQQVLLWAAAIVTAALVLAIAWIIGSDVRGRAAAAVATIDARSRVATKVIGVAQGQNRIVVSEPLVVPLPEGRSVALSSRPAADEAGWLAIAIEAAADPSKIRYLVVKGSEKTWASSEEIRFV